MDNYGKFISIVAIMFAPQFAAATPAATEARTAPPGYVTEQPKKASVQRTVSTPGYKLVPIENCDRSPIIDVLNDSVTYPCGFKLVKASNSGTAAKGPVQASVSAKSMGSSVRYNGSTIRDNGDGTSTINHGGSATEIIKTSEADKIIMQYGDSGLNVTRAKSANIMESKL